MDESVGVSTPTEENEAYVDVFEDDEREQIWEAMLREKSRHQKLDLDEARLKASRADRKRRKKEIATASKRRNR